MRGMLAFLLMACGVSGGDRLQRAEELYNKTDYRDSLALLQNLPAKDATAHSLAGKNYFMLGDYKKATEAFQKALALQPSSSEYAHWLGRTFGRRAENSNPFSAPMYASKARQYFELAVKL